MTDAEIYLDYLTHTFGEEDAILSHECPDGGPRVYVFVYKDLPEDGMITGVTHGLSIGNHPDWKYGKPELIVSVASSRDEWPEAAAWFAAQFRGIKRFRYGDVLTTDSPLAPDTTMDGFLLFAPSFLDREQASVTLNSYTVHLTQLYPIHRSELRAYDKLRLKEFWLHPDFDMYDVMRKPVTL